LILGHGSTPTSHRTALPWRPDLSELDAVRILGEVRAHRHRNLRSDHWDSTSKNADYLTIKYEKYMVLNQPNWGFNGLDQWIGFQKNRRLCVFVEDYHFPVSLFLHLMGQETTVSATEHQSLNHREYRTSGLLFGYDWVSVQLGRPANACR
jgi:hypothetical protein